MTRECGSVVFALRGRARRAVSAEGGGPGQFAAQRRFSLSTLGHPRLVIAGGLTIKLIQRRPDPGSSVLSTGPFAGQLVTTAVTYCSSSAASAASASARISPANSSRLRLAKNDASAAIFVPSIATSPASTSPPLTHNANTCSNSLAIAS